MCDEYQPIIMVFALIGIAAVIALLCTIIFGGRDDFHV